MPTINPMAMAQPFAKEINVGRKLVAAVGHQYRTVGQNNNPLVEIRLVVIKDMSQTQDEGATITDTFWLTERSLWRIAKLSMATGWCQSSSDTFDPAIEEQLIPVYLHAPFEVEIIEKQGNDGVMRKEVSRHYPCSIPNYAADETAKSHIKNAEDSWKRILAKSRVNSYGGNAGFTQSPDDDGSDLPF